MHIGSVVQLFPDTRRGTQLEDVPARDAERLLGTISDLSRLRDLEGVMQVVRVAARELSGADGVTFVLPEGDLVHYADEDAIGPLWKGRRFPRTACISGWAMTHRETVVIEDIYADPRIPHDAYRPTFVKSLMMVPIRPDEPLGAIGVYWATRHLASDRERALLEALAGATAVSVQNAQLYDEARRQARAREEFIAIMAHELRTPLTPIKLHLDLALRSLPEVGAGSAQRAISRVAAQVEGVVQMTERLLEMSRLSEGRPVLDRAPVDLAAIAREVTSRFAGEERPGQLSVDAPAPVLGVWDGRRVETAVSNLVANAVKYGEGRPIQITVCRDGPRARLAVRDHGVGILPEDHARIFDRFERAASARSYGGFGLGLWVAKQIVDAHDGVIHVESRPGEGSTFTVLLPL